MSFKETTQNSKSVFNGKVFSVHCDDVRLSDGRPAKREVVEHPGGVCIAAVDDEQHIYVVEQYRYPMGETIMELPAGKLEPGEDPEQAALRELQEETGLQARNIRLVGVLYPTPGYCSEKLYLYLATDLQQGAQQLDEGELLHCDRIPFSELRTLVLDNTIKDAKTAMLVLLADRILNHPEESL